MYNQRSDATTNKTFGEGLCGGLRVYIYIYIYIFIYIYGYIMYINTYTHAYIYIYLEYFVCCLHPLVTRVTHHDHLGSIAIAQWNE